LQCHAPKGEESSPFDALQIRGIPSHLLATPRPKLEEFRQFDSFAYALTFAPLQKQLEDPEDTVPVTMRALTQRIGRKLAKESKELRFGGRVLVDLTQANSLGLQGVVLDRNVDLEKLGREIGALKPWERLATVTPLSPPRSSVASARSRTTLARNSPGRVRDSS
jgi:hypothetical protein